MKLHTLSVRCLFLGACLSLATCAPPYIVELNTAAGLVNRMTLVGTLGIVSPGSSSANNVRFLPVKPTASDLSGVNIRSGFVVTSSSTTQNFQYVSLDSSGKAQTYGGNGFSSVTSDPNYPVNQFEVTTTTTTANLVALHYGSSGASELYRVDPSTGSFQTTISEGLSGVFAYPALGISVMPMPGAPDVFNFLFEDSTGTYFGEGYATIDTSFATVFTPQYEDFPPYILPVQRYFYYRNQAGTLSYASSYSGGSWTCYQWAPSTTAVVLPGATHRIDALLTTGDLLSTEGGTLRLYDSNGNQVLSVSLGGLQYCYEAYVGTTPYVFFSLTMSLREDKYAFNVYAIPTSAMRGLGG